MTAGGAASADLLGSLVGFDTTSRNSNLALIDFAEARLAEHGFAAERLPDASGTKAALLARIGPAAPGGIAWCAHTDTVPVDGQTWSSDPFTLTRRGDALVGRGTVDMKGFLACTLAALPLLAAADLQRPVWLVLTYDEEVGCLGAPAVAARLAADPYRPAVAVIGEPTEMAVVRAHKGIRVMRTTVRGRSAHSSQPAAGANAIIGAARLIAAIDDCARELRDRGIHDDDFAPPHTTFGIGTIGGGLALNVIPPECSFVWEYRFVPGEDVEGIHATLDAAIRDTVLPHLRATAPEAAVDTEVIADVPTLDPAGNGTAAKLVRKIGGLRPRTSVSYGSDGAALQAAGIPSVVCGPGRVAQMHEPDEAILLEELAACDRFLAAVIAWASDLASDT